MNKEEYQNNNLENMIAKKNELIRGKETFKTNLEKLFIDFKNDSFNPLYGQLKQNIFLIFDDYKNNAEAKLEDSKGDINTALLNMKAEIDKKLKEADEEYKLKQENLKAKINIVKEKIETFSIENINAILKNNKIKDKEIEIKKILEPNTITPSSFSPLSGNNLNFVEVTRFSSFIELVKYNTIVAPIGLFGIVVAAVGLGAYKVWKY